MRAADLAAKMIADMERGAPPYWLTFSGQPGTGKTMLAQQIHARAGMLADAATANHPPQYGTYDERRRRPGVRWLAATSFARLYLDDGQYDLPEYLGVEWLVSIDDLGTGPEGGKARSILADAYYRLANQRLGKWTIWTTNLTLDEVKAQIDARVSSRLIRDDNRLVTLTVTDYALRPKNSAAR